MARARQKSWCGGRTTRGCASTGGRWLPPRPVGGGLLGTQGGGTAGRRPPGSMVSNAPATCRAGDGGPPAARGSRPTAGARGRALSLGTGGEGPPAGAARCVRRTARVDTCCPPGTSGATVGPCAPAPPSSMVPRPCRAPHPHGHGRVLDWQREWSGDPAHPRPGVRPVQSIHLPPGDGGGGS